MEKVYKIITFLTSRWGALLTLLSICLLGLYMPGNVQKRAIADTNISGYISSDTIWTADESPYVVTDNVIVKKNVTINIEPGVTLMFEKGKSLLVQGTLIARGTDSSNITFTKHGSDNWGFIVFEDTSTNAVYDNNGNYQLGSIMEHCVVEFASSSFRSDNGAINIDNSFPCISHCTIKNNSINGIRAYNLNLRQQLIISNCEITDNSKSGIYCSGGSLNITDCTIKNNETAHYGGGIYADSFFSLMIENCTVTENTADKNGGGIYAFSQASSSTISISNCEVRKNTAGRHGGGINSYSSSSVTISDCTVAENKAGKVGGGIYAYSSYSTAMVNNCTVKGNTANSGGGIYAKSSLKMKDGPVTLNSAINGGGIYSDSSLTINDCIVKGNTADNGGGIYANSSLMISNCTIIKNSASNGSEVLIP